MLKRQKAVSKSKTLESEFEIGQKEFFLKTGAGQIGSKSKPAVFAIATPMVKEGAHWPLASQYPRIPGHEWPGRSMKSARKSRPGKKTEGPELGWTGGFAGIVKNPAAGAIRSIASRCKSPGFFVRWRICRIYESLPKEAFGPRSRMNFLLKKRGPAFVRPGRHNIQCAPKQHRPGPGTWSRSKE